MSKLTVKKMSEAQAVVQEAEIVEWETRRETDRWLGDDGAENEFEESQVRYQELRVAAESVVAILYAMQEPLLDDPYASWAGKLMTKAKALLTEIDDGELVERTTYVLANADKE